MAKENESKRKDTTSSIEIERRWLLKNPPSAEFLAAASCVMITQLFIANAPNCPKVCRLRRSVRSDGTVTYARTHKKHLSRLVSVEKRKALTEEEYLYLSNNFAQKSSTPLVKKRYSFTYQNQVFELDKIAFPISFWVLELEVPSTDTVVALPPDLAVDREVTFEGSWTEILSSKSAEI